MPTGFRLPAFEPGITPADFSPINNLLTTYRQQQQLGVENQRADEQMGMQRERLGMEKARASRDDESARVKRIGQMAQVVEMERDPTRRAALHQRFIQSNPDLAGHLVKAGMDPNDHMTVPKFLVAEAGLYDPLGQRAKEAEIQKTQAQIGLVGAQRDYYRSKAAPDVAPSAPQADPLSGAGIREDGTAILRGETPDPFAGPSLSGSAMVTGRPFMPPPMRLGGPMDDIDRSMLPDEGRGRPQGVQVAQAGGGVPPLMDQARQRAFGQSGTQASQVPGIVTTGGNRQSTDIPATREAAGQRAFEAAPADAQQRLLRMRQEQQFWNSAYGRPPRAGYYYGPDGREMALTDKNFKGDREAQAAALLNLRKIESASKLLTDTNYLSRTVQGALNVGDVGQAFADMKQGALGIAYALSGKTVAVAEMKNFIEAYGPQPGDSADRIINKTDRMRQFYEALLTASRGGEQYELAFAKAMAATGLKNPDGSKTGQPAAASAGAAPPQEDPAKARLKNKYGLE